MTDSFEKLQNLKVALVYDRVNTKYGGAEQVLLAFQDLFPKATLFTSVFDPLRAVWAKKFRKVNTSFLNHFSVLKNKHQWLAPLMPIAFESLNFSKYDLIISITSAEAKGIITNHNQLHICYLLTPPRYLYDFQKNYLDSKTLFSLPIVKQFTKFLLKYLKWWDQVAIYRPDVIVPLSEVVSNRIKTSYRVSTENPIYPPIDMIDFSIDNQALSRFNLPSDFHLVVSRLVFYKKIDIAIKACAKLNQNLVIVGSGEETDKLKTLANRLTKNSESEIIFLSSQPQTVVNTLMKQAKTFLSPGVDDFGLSPLQANLFNTPAIINSQSGVVPIFKKYGFGDMLMSDSSEELANKIIQTSSKSIKSANIDSIKKILGTKYFQQQFAQIIIKNIKR